MSSSNHIFQDRDYSFGSQDIDLNEYEHFPGSQQEKEAIAASVDELSESTYRSPSQQLAIETLRDFDDSKILDLLSAIRLSGQTHYPYPEGLSCEQYDALSLLEFCPDSHILLWLRSSRGREHLPP